MDLPLRMLTFLLALAVTATVALAVARAFDHPTWMMDRLRSVWYRIKRLNLWHVMAAVAVLALMLATAREPILWVFLGSFVLLVAFGRAWIKQVTFLMSLRDQDFPGRFDKLVWMFLLVFLAPIGYWTFRTFRDSRWPEPVVEVDTSHPIKTSAAPELA